MRFHNRSNGPAYNADAGWRGCPISTFKKVRDTWDRLTETSVSQEIPFVPNLNK